MRPWLALFVAALAINVLAIEEPELPAADDSQPLEIEPPLLVPARAPDGSIPDVNIVLAEKPGADMEKLESDLARAKKRATGAERLYKAGIIAKVDAEQRALKVVQLEATIAEARLQEAKTRAEATSDEETKISLADAAAAAKAATEERQRAEIEAALRNLQRQQKLLALGSGRKSEVNRAEKKLAELQAAGGGEAEKR